MCFSLVYAPGWYLSLLLVMISDGLGFWEKEELFFCLILFLARLFVFSGSDFYLLKLSCCFPEQGLSSFMLIDFLMWAACCIGGLSIVLDFFVFVLGLVVRNALEELVCWIKIFFMSYFLWRYFQIFRNHWNFILLKLIFFTHYLVLEWSSKNFQLHLNFPHKISNH